MLLPKYQASVTYKQLILDCLKVYGVYAQLQAKRDEMWRSQKPHASVCLQGLHSSNGHCPLDAFHRFLYHHFQMYWGK